MEVSKAMRSLWRFRDPTDNPISDEKQNRTEARLKRDGLTFTMFAIFYYLQLDYYDAKTAFFLFIAIMIASIVTLNVTRKISIKFAYALEITSVLVNIGYSREGGFYDWAILIVVFLCSTCSWNTKVC